MIFYYVRHGDPIYDPDSLTALGRRQAESVGRRFAVHGLDKIYASSSARAIQTAQPACEILKKEAEILDWCNEGHAWRELTVKLDDRSLRWCFHHRPSREIFARGELLRMGKEFYKHPLITEDKYLSKIDFEQGLGRIQRETDALLATLGYSHDSERGGYIVTARNEDRVALFAHQGFGLAFLSCLMDIPYNQFCSRFDMTHTGVTVIEFSGQKGELCIPKMLQLSNDSHLYKDGLGTKYNNWMYL